MSTLFSPMSQDELRQLAAVDFAAFKERFTRLVPRIDFLTMRMPYPGTCDPYEVAEMLRATSAGLFKLGVKPDLRGSQARYAGWDQLEKCLEVAASDDALVIFKAMANTLQECSLPDCLHLMKAAFKQPAWRLQAIEEMPHFFRLKLPHDFKMGVCNLDDFPPANTYEAFASLDQEDGSGNLSTVKEVICTLKRVGAIPSINPLDNRVCLHVATANQSAKHLQAFIEEFPEQIDAVDKAGERPLMTATLLDHAAKVEMLLDAGADPRLCDKRGVTLLGEAVYYGCIATAKLLLSRGLYSDWDLDHACSVDIMNPSILPEVRAFQAAIKAQQAIDQTVINGALENNKLAISRL